MTLIELISKNEWIDVKPILIELFPKENRTYKLKAYEFVYSKLQKMKTIPSKDTIILERVCTPEEEFVDVYSIKPTDKENWALDFVPWQECLGMNISTKSLSEFNELEIISFCLYEMTFYGFSQSKIKEQFDQFINGSDEIDKKYS
ncbi:DUF6557 family protein [Mangrovimonas sp. DI 80]|uniref:DUF6557 family protein n=1 Tax=Mangrovimonas sp. DI 80 TaxID=1779330 RepID=UPI0009785B9A|nr:DUF6557 family protein [Mangrovimonas sp. DI 80]OMP32268.1 hypothetical protein BKM32_04240 [Mangrovimonas sp. DI 80]